MQMTRSKNTNPFWWFNENEQMSKTNNQNKLFEQNKNQVDAICYSI